MRLAGWGMDGGSREDGARTDEQGLCSGCCVHSADCHNMESYARKAKYIVKVSQDALGELKMKCQQQMSLTVLQMNIQLPRGSGRRSLALAP